MRSDAQLLSIPPRLGESIGLTDRAPKTASLLFDRVVTVGAEPCPAPIGFTAFDFGQQRQGGRTIQYEFVIQDGATFQFLVGHRNGAKIRKRIHGKRLDAGLSAVSNFTLRAAAEEIRLKLGFGAYPVYHSTGAYSAEYKPGNYEVVIASLDNLKIVHEDSLDWQQILDFRSDEDARRKYRRMVHWLDSSMVGKSQSFVQDELAIKMETYETALRKHRNKDVPRNLGRCPRSQSTCCGRRCRGSTVSVG